MAELDHDIQRYYEADWDEDARLRSGLNELELIRTRELIRRELHGRTLRILDVGGASGIHAEWLLDDGHTVELVDPVPLHVEQAEAALGDRDAFSARVGDARSLGEPTDLSDVVLLLGPLYHLPERSDRLLALTEAIRVCRPAGLVVVAAISRFASLFSGLTQDEYHVPEFRSVIERDLDEGQHRNVPGRDYFTTAFFHHPDELRSELEEAGLEDVRIVAVESVLGALPGLAGDWMDPHRRAILLDLIGRVDEEPSLLGIGPHLLAIAHTPVATDS